MVSRESVEEVFLPVKEDCLEYLREQRWPEEVTCPHCESADMIKKGTTKKGAQRYRCHSIFNDLTETMFSEHKPSLLEMFRIIRGMEENKTAEIAQELDRTYKPVLDFVHDVQDVLNDDSEFDLTGICEADEVYVVAGDKGLYQDEPRDRGLKKGRGTYESDKPPVVTLVRRIFQTVVGPTQVDKTQQAFVFR